MNGGRGEPEAGHRTWPAWTGRWLGPVLIAVVLAFAAILDLDEHDAVNTALGAFVVVAAAALMIVAWRRPRAGLALPGLTMVSCLAPALGRAIGHPGIEPPVPGALTLVGAATVTAWAGARRADRRWAVRLVASSGLSILATVSVSSWPEP